MKKELLRSLPKVDEVLKYNEIKMNIESANIGLVTDGVREAINDLRKEILSGEIESFNKETIIAMTQKYIKGEQSSNLKAVINATGTVLHTNLGRAALGEEVIERVVEVARGYSNLEYNIEKAQRGSRYDHIEDLLVELTGAEAAVVVNNNAAAVLLILDTMCKGKESVVSRGQLVEIGGSFRIPEVMKYSNTKLVEVGTTNRTHLKDYEEVINEETGMLLKVHTSNYKIMGFTKEVEASELVELGEKYGVPVYEDLGSGVLIDLSKYGFEYEPTVQESVQSGVDIVSFSGDKMLGGPQAGIIVGKKEYIDRIKKNQLTRALRVDKMTLAALEATLQCYKYEEEAIKNIPTLNMLLITKEELNQKADKLKQEIEKSTTSYRVSTEDNVSMVGGGSMPTHEMDTRVVTVQSDLISSVKLEGMLRNREESIVCRIGKDALMIDVRTVSEREFKIIVEALKEVEHSLQESANMGENKVI